MRGFLRRPTFAKGAALGALVSCGMLVATAAFAGNGVGALFNLGANNTVNASTVLAGSTNGQQLRVVNNSTGGAATGVGIHTATNKPPLAVNSRTKVTNLNVDTLDGTDSSALQRRVTGTCPNHLLMTRVNADGSVGCGFEAIYTFDRHVLAEGQATDNLLPDTLSITTVCHPNKGAPAGFQLKDGGPSSATVDWVLSTGGAATTVNAGRFALPVGAVRNFYPADFSAGANRIEGQFVWNDQNSVTLNLHFFDAGSSGCELTGTAEVGLT